MGPAWILLCAFVLLQNLNFGWAVSDWDCTFEKDICKYAVGVSNTMAWARTQATDRPSTDHTLQPQGKGWYIKSKSGEYVMGTTTFMSHSKLKTKTNQYCLSFYMYQSDKWLHLIQVIVGDTIIAIKSGDNEMSEKGHEVWQRIEVQIPKLDKDGSLRFLLSKTGFGLSMVAIDDIVVTQGACQPDTGPDCTFERGQCGWHLFDYQFDLKLVSQISDSTYTFDHTLSTKYGHFMLGKSGGKNVGKTTGFLGPELKFTNGVCMRFFYIFSGDGDNHLYVNTVYKSSGYRVYNDQVAPKGKWIRGEAYISNPKGKKVSFHYTSVSGSGNKYFGLDDISFSLGLCPERMTVSFESGSLDPWSNLGPVNWNVIQTNKPGAVYPHKDITLGNNQGHVAFVKPADKTISSQARLSYYNLQASTHSCMSFYVFSAGTDPGRMEVQRVDYTPKTTMTTIWSWTPNAHEKGKFVRAQFSHDHAKTTSTWIVVNFGKDGSWAIDDISTTAAVNCQALPLTSNGRTLKPNVFFPASTTPGPLPTSGFYDCNFDKDVCRWSIANDMRRGWKLTRGSAFSPVLPYFDHTHGSSLGQFLHVGSGYSSMGYTAILRSIQIPPGDGYGPQGCLSFWYYIYAPTGDKSELKVIVLSNSMEVTAFSTAAMTQDWTQAKIDVTKKETIGIRIEATKGANTADISIDDIVYSKLPCKDDKVMGDQCVFEQSDICGFTQDKTDRFDWTWHKGMDMPSLKDHNTNTKYGHMMLLQGSGRKVGDVATLISPKIDGFDGCLIFWLYGGKNAANLKVSTKVTRKKTILSKHIYKTNNWFKVEVPVYSDDKFNIYFSGEVTSSASKDNFLALDDIQMKDYECDTTAACSFEFLEMCTWYSPDDKKFQAVIIRAMDVKEQMHPGKDHTLDLATGHFLFFNPKTHSVGDQAIYESDVFAKNNFQCMEFVMSNTGMFISVYVVDFMGGENLVFRRTTDTPAWLHISFTVGNKKDEYMIRFVAEVRYSSNGGVSIDDINFSPGRCDGSQTAVIETTPAPVTVPSTQRQRITWAPVVRPYTVYDCDFEDNTYCRWIPDKAPNSFFLAKAYFMHIKDHSKKTGDGYVISSPRYSTVGTKSVLTSPDISAGFRCLIFYLKSPMLGGTNLTVFKQLNNMKIPVFYSSMSSLSTSDWQRVEVPIDSKYSHKVVFQAVKVTSIVGGIYLDDISLPTGDCPKDTATFNDVRCDFEADNNAMCGYTQDKTDDYDWVVSSRRMKLPAKLPSVEDRTLNSSDGHFILSKLMTGKKAGSKARLISPSYVTGKGSKHCLSFFYHMSGYNIGHMNVYIAPDGQEGHLTPAMMKWSRHYDMGSMWQKAFVQIIQPGTYHVVFEVVKSSDDYIYGVDDIQIVKGTCPSQDRCTFEEGICEWRYMGFLLGQPTQDKKLGISIPAVDHTNGSPSGHFLFFNVPPGSSPMGARLFDTVRDNSENVTCFTFWYHMHGDDGIGYLRVLVNEADANSSYSSEAILWELAGPTGDDAWHSAQVPIPSVYTQRPFRVMMETQSKKSVTGGDISIDDTAFFKSCTLYPSNASPAKYSSQEIACNFDKGTTCNWRDYGQKANFKVTNKADSYLRIKDHTNEQSGFSYGKFLVLASKDYDKGVQAILKSPVIGPTSGPRCFSFWYTLNPTSKGELSVLVQTGSQTVRHWKDTGRGDKTGWKYADVNLHSDFDFQLVLKATVGIKNYGDIAIDDMKMRKGACKRDVLCTLDESPDCDFHATDDSTFKWKRIDLMNVNPFPLPDLTENGDYEGFYMASEFKGHQNGDKAGLESKMYLPSQGECVSLYVASGYNSDMANKESSIKGTFAIFMVPKNADGTKGARQHLYSVIITEERWWKEVHFDVKSDTPYWLIFEAAVIDPAGYVAIDDIVFSPTPCPSDLDCNFEGGDSCGYDSITNVEWSLVRSGLLSSVLGKYEHDHTTRSRNGHYMLYQYDPDVKVTPQEARLSSYLQTTKSYAECMTLWFTGYGSATLGVSTFNSMKVENVLLQKAISFKKHSIYQDYSWDYLRLDLPVMKQPFYLDIWTKSSTPKTAVAIDDITVQRGSCEEVDKKKEAPKKPYFDLMKGSFYLDIWAQSSTPKTAVAIDDITVQRGSCEEVDKKKEAPKKPYCDPAKKLMGCSYEDNKCPVADKTWKIRKPFSYDYQKDKYNPVSDHTTETDKGHFLFTKSQGKTSSVQSSLLPVSSMTKTPVCLDFYLYMHGGKSTTFNLYTSTDNLKTETKYFSRHGDYRHEQWMHQLVELPGEFHDLIISLEAKFGEYDTGYIALDDISMYAQPCPPMGFCEFEEDGWCGYEQDNMDDFDWKIQLGGDLKRIAGPSKDHTLQTSKGHYAIADATSPNKDQKSRLLSPMYKSDQAKCLSFWFSFDSSNTNTASDHLDVYVREEGGREIFLDTISGKFDNVWTKALFPVKVEGINKLQFVFSGNLRHSTSHKGIAIDDIQVSDIDCHEAINCDFTLDSLCGWQNSESNLIDWEPFGGADLSIPIRRVRNTSVSVAVLESEVIPVEQGRQFCMAVKYNIIGQVNHNLKVYIEGATGREYLMKDLKITKHSMKGTLYVPSKTTKYATTIRVLIKLFYGNESQWGSATIKNINFQDLPCSELKQKEEEGFKCKKYPYKKLAGTQVCNFVNDCSYSWDKSDEENCGSCTFENGYCGWADMSDGMSSFTVTNNYNTSGNLNMHNHYLLLKNGEEDAHHHADVVLTQMIGPTPVGCSISFDYYAESRNRGRYSSIRYPIDYGTLVLVLDINGDQTVVWKNPRGSSQDWHTVRVDIGHIRHRVQLHFQAEHYSYTSNVIAVDNTELVGCTYPSKNQEPCSKDRFTCKSGGCIDGFRKCDMTIDCQDASDEDDKLCESYLEDDFEYGLAEWSQEKKSDDFDWVRMQGKSSDLKGGAKRDHTLGTNKGHYMVIQGGSLHKKGDVARLLGPVFKPTTGDTCWMMIYTHLFDGLGNGKLNIKKKTTLQGPMVTLRTIPVHDSYEWLGHIIYLNSDQVFQIVIEGIVGGYHSADMGIDDISFSPGCNRTTTQPLPQGVAPTMKPTVCKPGQFPCTSGTPQCIDANLHCDWKTDCSDGSDEMGCGPCPFDSDMCGWQDVSNGRIMFKSLAVKDATGVDPKTDHTHLTQNSTQGSYLKVVTAYGDFTSPAKLLGPVLPPTSPTCKIGVYLYKSGPTRGQITIGVQNPDNIYRGEDIVARLPFQHYHYATWLKLYGQFGKLPRGYQPFVEISSSNVNKDITIAIDDVFFEDCGHNKVYNISGANCDFENDMCEWFVDNLKGEKWVRTDQSTPLPNTGPDRDHTTGTGYYLYATSPPEDIGEKLTHASLRSATLQWPDGKDEGCLSFWYVMFGTYVEGLKVYLEKDENKKSGIVIFSKSYSQGNVWRQGFATIKTSGKFQIEFRVVVPNNLGDIALDDIQLTAQACPNIPECDFESGLCGFHSKSEAWRLTKPIVKTGYPTADHTLGNKNGHYLAMDFTNLTAGTKSIMTSPVYPMIQSKMCLSVNVHSSLIINMVNVYAKSKADTGNGIFLFTVSVLGSDVWEYKLKTFTPRDDYQIVFEGVTVDKEKGPISFDDFRIELGECPMAGSCNFEKDTCGYTMSSDSSWVWHSGRYLNDKTGPPVDHTTKTQEGFYLVADSYVVSYLHNFFPKNDVFELYSPFLAPTKSQHMCFSFWYYMNGNSNDMSMFEVKFEDNIKADTIFTNGKSMGERWNYKALDISTKDDYPYQITFVVTIGKKGESDVAIDDILITNGNCTQRKSSTLTPEVPKTYPPTQFDCTFDQGNACNWTVDQGQNATLKVVSKSDNKYAAIPYDHTQENEKGRFLRFNPHDPLPLLTKRDPRDHPHSYASIVSPELEQHNIDNGTCLKFWYIIEENANGFILVRLLKDNGEFDNLWRRDIVQVSAWSYAQIHSSSKFYVSKNSTSLKFKILFHTVLDTYEEFRIDDISLNDGPCLDNLQHCDFEEQGICGFLQDKTESLDWIRYPYKAPYLWSNAIDHTYGTRDGHYMYLYNAANLGASAMGRMQSPVIDVTPASGKCLRFFYYASRTTAGQTKLRVKALSEEESEILLWEENLSNTFWTQERVDINFVTPSRIVFEGVLGSDPRAFIGLDDVNLLGYPCPKPATCDFEKDMCLFHNNHNFDDFDWVRHSGPTSTKDTGPDVDATTGTKLGHYMYIESSSPRLNGAHADLLSETLPATSGSCLSLSYNMHGKDIGQLNIFQHKRKDKNVDILIHSIKGDQGSNWHQTFINITSQEKFYLRFMAQIGTVPKSDIAIDDVAYSDGFCSQTVADNTFACSDGKKIEKNQVCDFVSQCGDGSDEALCGDCTFEKGLCGYVAHVSQQSSYLFKVGRSFGGVKDLGNDHTKGTKYGYMAYISGLPTLKNRDVYLRSTLLQKSYQACQLKFYYKLMNRYASLKVGLEFADGSRLQIFSATSTMNYGSWMEGSAQIGHIFEPFRIVFAGKRITRSTPFAIDDITLKDCSPPTPTHYTDSTLFNCHNGYQIQQKDVCDLADDCGDGSDEINCQNVTACDFERSMCTWSERFSGFSIMWKRQTGALTSFTRQPRRDHTTGTPSGHFLYYSPGIFSINKKAEIISEVVKGVKEGEKCWLTIYYQILGTSDSLNIFLQTKHNGYRLKLFTKHSQEQKYWDRVIISLKSKSDFQIIVQGTHTSYTQSSISLDDIVFSSGCHMAGSSATLPPTSSPLTTKITPVNNCLLDNQFQCGEGTCISKKLVCDFTKDCQDGSDEKNCGTCDFEGNGMCGWYDSSTGRIGFARSTPDVMGRLGPVNDTTTKSSKGHYLYATLSTGISDTPAVIKSSSLPSIGRNCYFSFSYNINTTSDINIEFSAVTKDLSHFDLDKFFVSHYSLGWNQATMYFIKDDVSKKLEEGWHLEISLVYKETFSPPLSGMFAIDDFKFNSCDRKSQMPGLTCDFSYGLCDWEQSKKDIFNWKIIKDDKMVMHANKAYYREGKFLIAKSQGQVINDVAMIESPQLPPNVNSTCLSFYYYMPGTRGILGVVETNFLQSSIIFQRNANGYKYWHRAYVSLNSRFPYKLDIRAVVSGVSGDDIAIDDIMYYPHSCQQEQGQECTFDDGNMCSWVNPTTSQGVQWSIRNGIKTLATPSLPKFDHTTLTKYGYFAYMPINDGNSGEQAVLEDQTSENLNNYYSSCFTFWYHMNGGKTPQIQVYVNSTQGKEELKATYPGPTGDMWRRGSVTVKTVNGYNIFLKGGAQGGNGHIAIDDTNLVNGKCSPAGSCDFQHDLCGYVNSPSNEFKFVAVKFPFLSYLPHAMAKPTVNLKKGDTAVLISDPITKSACLYFDAYLKSDSILHGLVQQTLNVYTRELISPQNKTLMKTINYFVRNDYTPRIEVNLLNITNFEILFEVVYAGDIGVTVGLRNIDLKDYGCYSYQTTTPTTVIPSIPPVHPPSPFDCQFEGTTCGWKILSKTKQTWSLSKYHSKPLYFSRFVIWYDHTLNNANGNFVLASNYRSKKAVFAYMVSPKVDMKGSMCFQFWYYMFGPNTGTLNLMLNTKTNLWTRTGSQGPQWNFAAVHIANVKQGFLSFEAGGSTRFDGIAVDDISAFYGKCPEKNGCDFENGICDYEVQQAGYSPWKLISGMFLEKLVTPLVSDHTVKTSAGWAVAMDSASMLSASKGRMTTTPFTATENSCLTFWYHMKSSEGEVTLTVHKFDSHSTITDSQIAYSVRGSQGPSWQLGTIDVQESSNFILTFEGMIGLSEKNGVIAIDDIKLKDGKCPRFGWCDFEDDLCAWRNTKIGDTNDWLRFRGDLLTTVSWDHTLGTMYGSYLITNQAKGNAILVSPTLQANFYHCVTLWASLDKNSLNVSTVDINGNALGLIDSKDRIVTDSKPKTNVWKQYQFSINPSSYQFQVLIKGGVVSGEIRLDDLSVYNQECSKVASLSQKSQQFYCQATKTWLPISKKCDFVVDCLGNNEEVDCGYDCTFDDSPSTCKWENNARHLRQSGLWEIGTGSLYKFQAKSFVDHTLRSVNGHFLYNSPSDSYRSVTIYQSPQLQSSGASCQIKFSYYKVFPNVEFKVMKVQRDVETKLFALDNSRDFAQSQWEDISIPLGRMHTPFHIQLQMTGGYTQKHRTFPRLLLDDITFMNCALPSNDGSGCKGRFMCNNGACVDKTALCNLQDDCGDNSDEYNSQCNNHMTCNFDDGSLCYWQQEVGTDEFDWHIYQTKTYPDHTTRSAEGFVASGADLNNMRKPTDRAHLISPVIENGTGCRFTLNYKMNFGSKGKFNIYSRTEINGDLVLLGTPEPGGMFVWKTFSRLLFNSKPYQVVLEILPSEYKKSIDIDDTIFDVGCIKSKASFPEVAPKSRPTQPPKPCGPDEFECRKGGCIPRLQVCDLLFQCDSDKSDEEQCSSCNFDSGMCSWKDTSTGYYNWEYTIAVADARVGPTEDHTNSSVALSHGVLSIVKGSTVMTQGPAILTSGVIRATPSDCVLNFWVYVKNPSSTELSVIYQQFGDDNNLKEKYTLNTFHLKNFRQSYWTKIESTIGYQKFGGEISLKANVNGFDSSSSIIAIDDVSFSKCKMGIPKDECASGERQCDNKVCISSNEWCDSHADCSDLSDEANCYDYKMCDFSTIGNCGLGMDPTSTANWTLTSGNSASSDLSPSRDHSKYTRTDHFLQVNPSLSTQSAPLYARLKSPVIYLGSKPGITCNLRLFYYQKTNVSKSFNIYTQYEEDGPLKQQWSNQHGTNGVWEKAIIRLVGKRPMRVIIEGVSNKNTAVAIDDLSLTPGCDTEDSSTSLPEIYTSDKQGSCPFGYFQCDGNKCLPNRFACDNVAQCKDRTDEINCGLPCDFEQGSCGWMKKLDDSDTVSNITAVDVGVYKVSGDHKPGSPKGHVILGPGKKFATSYFMSPFYQSSFGDCKFSFWRNANGNRYAVTNVEMDHGYRDTVNLGRDSSVVLKESVNKWKKVTVQLPQCASHFKLIISQRNSDMANPVLFDDFKFEDCPSQQYVSQCKAKEFMCKDKLKCIPDALKCDLANDCCDGSDEDPYVCYKYKRTTFDWGLGKWKQEKDDEGDWSLTNGGAYYNNFPVDHTSGKKLGGNYVRFAPYTDRKTAKLSYAMNKPLQNCRMRLWYSGVNTYGETSGTLNIYLRTGVTWIKQLKLITVHATDGKWRKVVVPIQIREPYSIVLEAVAGLTVPSGISVDDVSFTPMCDMGFSTPPPIFIPHTLFTLQPSKLHTTIPTTSPKMTGKTTNHPQHKTTAAVTTATTLATTATTLATTAPPAVCSGQFQCHATKRCIPLNKKCDFNYDCLDDSDEHGCYTGSVCDFTHSQCGWTASAKVNGVGWVRDTPTGAISGEAPSYDAGSGKGTQGHFMYLSVSGKALSDKKSERRATMNSIMFNRAAASCMVEFSLFMQGSGAGLSLYIKTDGSKSDLIWKSESVTGGKWQKITVSIGRRKGPFSLEFFKEVSSSYKGITAIDNVHFIMCGGPSDVVTCTPADKAFSCGNKACIKRILLCNGQDDCGDNSDENKALCNGFTVDNFDSGLGSLSQTHHYDTLDWKIWTSKTLPPLTLPAMDHTTFSPKGSYAYVVGNNPGDSAWLLSSNWISTSSSSGGTPCRGTVYVMAPESSGGFTIGTRTHNTGQPDKWMVNLNTTSSVWTQAEFVVDEDKPFQLVFKADFTQAGSAVAIDDFIMSPNCRLYKKDLPNLSCLASQFECLSNSVCIDIAKKCDGKKDCADGTDESECATKTTQAPTTTTAPNKPSSPSTAKPTTTQKNTAQKSVSSGSSDSWKMPVGVVVGLIALVALVVVVIVFLKRRQRLSWLRLPTVRTNILSRDKGMENPLYEYGAGDASASNSSDFQLGDMSVKNPNDIFGDSTKQDNNEAFDNPLYVDNAGTTEA